MKKILIISLFVLAMIIPNINVKAVDVSNEEELRNAIEQGGDITLTKDIEVKEPLVIDKDVNISGRRIMMQGDNTLMTINSGNVTFNDVYLYAGWNDKSYNKSYFLEYNVVENQGTAIVVNGGSVNFEDDSFIIAGKLGIEVNGGSVTGGMRIYAGEINYDNDAHSGGQGMVVNGGNVDLNNCDIFSGGTALTLNKGFDMTLKEEDYNSIISYGGNGIEINDGSVLNIGSINNFSKIFGSKNAIYLNGGTANLSGFFNLSSSNTGYGIYVNKGINVKAGGDVLNLKNDFIFGYELGTDSNFSIYVSPDTTELRLTDEKGFLELINNKLNLGFCSKTYMVPAPISQTEDEKKAICTNLNSNYDGPIYTNELGKYTAVYINGVKQNEEDASCNPVADNKNEPSQIVNVPATSAYASIIIIVLGILCVIVSVIVTRKVTKKS